MRADMSVGDNTDPNTMIIIAGDFGFAWHDESDRRHQSESLSASSHCGRKEVQIVRNAEVIDSGSLQPHATNDYSIFAGLRLAGSGGLRIDDYALETGDQIRILDISPADQKRLWEKMRKR